MSNPEHIQAALRALAPSGRSYFDDEASGDSVAPWLVGSLSMPSPRANLAGGSHGGVATWSVWVVGNTAGQARVNAQFAVDAWGGKRVAVDGYTPFTLVHRLTNGPYAAGRTVTDTNLRFQVIRLGFDLVASQTA